MPGKPNVKKMALKTGYQIDPDFNFFKYFDYYMALKIKGNMKIIILYLIKCHGKDGLINPSQKDMAKKCGMNLTQLKDNLKKLEHLGLIKRYRTGRSCYYWIAKPDRPESRLSDSPESGLSLLKGKENEKKNNNVVVSLASKYGFELDEKITEMLDGYPDKKLIDLFEYTKSKKPDNPNGFIFDAVKYDWKIPEYKPVKTSWDIAREQDEKNRQRMGPRDGTCLSVAEMRAIRTTNYAARAGA